MASWNRNVSAGILIPTPQTPKNISSNINGMKNYLSGVTQSANDPNDLTNDPTYKAYLDAQNQLADAQKQAQYAALDTAYNNAVTDAGNTFTANLNTLQGTKSGISSTYEAKRNAAAANADVGAANFAQYMAARGIKGNAGAMPQIYQTIGAQNAQNQLNTAEAQDTSNVDTQIANLNTAYQNNLTNLKNNLASNKTAAGANVDVAALTSQTQALMDAANRQITNADKNKTDWSNTATQYASDYQSQIDKLTALKNAGQTVDSDGINIDYKIGVLGSLRNQKIAQLQAAQNAANQQAFENSLAQYKAETTAQNDAERNAIAQYEATHKNYGGSGGGSSGYGATSKELNALQSDMNMMANRYTVAGVLTDEGKASLRAYANKYGGQYAQQLLDMFGLTSDGKNSKVPTSLPRNYNEVATEATNKRLAGESPIKISDYLSLAVSQGQLTESEARQIGQKIGIYN